jgi:uncharacterized membrane-anchored protein YhcB (DUF1043 family)
MMRLVTVLVVMEITITTAVLVLTPVDFEQRALALLLGVVIGLVVFRVTTLLPPVAQQSAPKTDTSDARPHLTQVA